MSGSSVIGRTSATRQAATGSTPRAMSEPACTSMRVEMPSSRPWPLRLRARSATLTSFDGRRGVDAGLVGDDLGLDLVRGIAEVERAEALLGGGLQVLHQALVAGVVGDDEQEVGVRVQQLALLLEGKRAPRCR